MIMFTRFKIGLITISLLVTALAWAPLVDAAPKPSATTGKSDLNGDGVVDYDDLVIFSADYLGQNVETVDWCTFLEATSLEEDLYGRTPSFYIRHFSVLLSFIENYFGCTPSSDLNGDGLINTRDLIAFSEKYARTHFLQFDWCAFLQGVMDGSSQYDYPASYYLEYYGSLLLYIQDKYHCSDGPPPVDPLALKNNPKFLTRIAASRNLTGDYYVTDAKIGSVFIYDLNLVLTGELKGLAAPLGIAVNSSGHILVGNDKRNNVEVYNPDSGSLLTTFGESELEMPTSITVDSMDHVYVTDARSNTIYVYDSAYQLITNIGEPGKGPDQIRSPSDAVLSADESELFVADRLNKRIQVFNLNGDFLRSILPEKCGWFSCDPNTATFTRLQDMDIDSQGRLHVLDIFNVMVAIIDPQTGAIVGRYGSYGLTDGLLKSPIGLVADGNQALVTDGGKNKIEALVIP
jgi:hypothetical protein